MKIGILTFHDGINFGAFLQVYSMQEALVGLGHEVVVLNYKNFRHWFNEYRGFLVTKRFSTLKNNTSKIRKFHKVQKRLLHLTPFSFALDRRNPYGLDVVLVGADEVWNYQTKLIGLDPTYFVPKLDGARYISYAASFGSVPGGTTLPDSLTNGLRAFSHISVRDSNSFSLIESNVQKTPSIVLDPTFLFPSYEKAVTPPQTGYYLYYSADIPTQYQQMILKFAHDKGKKLVAIGYKATWADENIVSLDPFEWMGWIKNADFVFTTMFHGTIYSILQEKQFVTMVTEYRKNKLLPMMNDLGLENRMVTLDEMLASNISYILEQWIDYEAVKSRIESLKKDSFSFINTALRS